MVHCPHTNCTAAWARVAPRLLIISSFALFGMLEKRTVEERSIDLFRNLSVNSPADSPTLAQTWAKRGDLAGFSNPTD